MVISVALLGYGKVARELHGPVWKALEQERRAAVNWICEPSAAGSRQAQRDFPNAHVTRDDAEGVIEDVPCEAVDLCTPGHTHAEFAASLLKQGCHLLVEKPLCHRLVELDAIQAVSTGRIVGVCQTHRATTPVHAARVALQEGRLGELMRVQVYHHARHILNENSWVTDFRPDGVLFENVIHFVDLALYLLNSTGMTIDGLKFFETPHRRIVTGIELLAHDTEGRHVALDVVQDSIAQSALFSRTLLSGSGADAELRFSPPGFRIMSGVQDPVGELVAASRRAVSAVRSVLNPAHVITPHEHLIRDFVESLESGRPVMISPEQVRGTTILLEEISRRWSVSEVEESSNRKVSFSVPCASPRK